MRGIARVIAQLYPAAWRRRYGSEFEALLEDLDVGYRDLLNVLVGAMRMRIATRFVWIVTAFGLAGAAL